MNTDHCLVEREGHVLTVTLNRPEAKNALSSGMLLGMYKAWRMLDEDDDLRVAIAHQCARDVGPSKRFLGVALSGTDFRETANRHNSAAIMRIASPQAHRPAEGAASAQGHSGVRATVECVPGVSLA